jgi:hypothetical protein
MNNGAELSSSDGHTKIKEAADPQPARRAIAQVEVGICPSRGCRTTENG